MDALTAFHSDVEGFLEDIVLSFGIHGGRSPAVVWPQGEASVVQALVAAHDRTEPSAGGVPQFVARTLGELVGRRVNVRHRTVRAGHMEEERHITLDTLAVMLRGALEVRTRTLGDGELGEVDRFRYRILTGEVLYIPPGFSCVLAGQHSAALLMELALDN
jgi:hypothetical protein